MGNGPRCSSCGDWPLENLVVLCSSCVDLDGVSAYCRGCDTRFRFTIPQARALFVTMGKKISYARPGVVIVFLERCSLCRTDCEPQLYPSRILVAELAHDASVH